MSLSGVAAQNCQEDEGAAQWAEVYCNSAEHGKWVHVDPLLDWLDSPDRVEGSADRCFLVLFSACASSAVVRHVTIMSPLSIHLLAICFSV